MNNDTNRPVSKLANHRIYYFSTKYNRWLEFDDSADGRVRKAHERAASLRARGVKALVHTELIA